MGVGVLIEGAPGTGKSYSIKNFDPEEVGVFEVEKTQLPFQKKFKVAKRATYNMIMSALKDPKLKAYVIDDSQYLMANENFDRVKEVGYQKFTEMALHFRNLIHWVNHGIPDDVIVYFLHHTETDSTTGKTKAKTIGKMLDNQLTVEGCFNIVLQTEVENGQYYFLTQSDGFTTAKSPEGMFELKIPNDLKAVDTRIREYWDLSETDWKEVE